MDTKIDVESLTECLPDVLGRVRERGERFVIEANGEAIATLAPAKSQIGTTWRELAAALRDVPWPDEDFAKDLEAIQAAQGVAQGNQWVATIVSSHPRPGITLRELITQVGNLELPGDGFADDLEAIQAAQGMAEIIEWPT